MPRTNELPKMFFSNVNGQSQNGNSGKRGKALYSEAHRQETRGTISYGTELVNVGRDENALITEAMMNNWSPAKIRAVAKQRGMNRRFVNALVDQILRIEGWAILAMHAQATGADLIYYLITKGALTLDKINELAYRYETEDAMDDELAQIVAEGKSDLVALSRISREAYMADVERILRGND